MNSTSARSPARPAGNAMTCTEITVEESAQRGKYSSQSSDLLLCLWARACVRARLWSQSREVERWILNGRQVHLPFRGQSRRITNYRALKNVIPSLHKSYICTNCRFWLLDGVGNVVHHCVTSHAASDTRRSMEALGQRVSNASQSGARSASMQPIGLLSLLMSLYVCVFVCVPFCSQRFGKLLHFFWSREDHWVLCTDGWAWCWDIWHSRQSSVLLSWRSWPWCSFLQHPYGVTSFTVRNLTGQPDPHLSPLRVFTVFC